MSKRRSTFVDYLGFLVLQGAAGVLLLLPQTWSEAVVVGAARLVYHLDRRHRRVAIENLRRAFPGQHCDAELRRITLDVYRHFARVLLGLLLLPRAFASRAWRQAQEATMTPEMQRLHASRRPVLIVTAHFGSWEAAAFILSCFGVRAHLVARTMDNPYIDDTIRRLRESNGHRMLSKQGDVRRMLSVLKAGGVVCTLADQYAGRHGLFVDFFGRPASTQKVFAVLAQRTEAVIVVVGAQNMGGLLDYALRVTDVIDPREYAGRPDAIRAITQRLTTGIERLVRLDPRQYFWLHRRWKNSPEPEAPAARAA